jgi:hypothetical protein
LSNLGDHRGLFSPSRIPVTLLLSILQPLLLRRVSLLQLLRLLLMPLLKLRPPRLRPSLRQPLVLLLLFLLEFPSFLFLLRKELFLVLLVFLVQL